MPDNIKYKEKSGRFAYIEPTEFAEYKIKEEKRFTGNSYPDNISWDQEDLQYTVDLQVICPDRYNENSYVKRQIKSNSIVTGSKDWVSFLNGNTLGNENFLTDAYTEITFQEINNNKESQKEALGIDSIEISFDSHFFPLVTMKFTDVRAAALFGPADYEYAQNARIEVLMAKDKLTDKESKELNELKNKTSSSFFKSLFHFPYPRFMLSVMGYYGEKVTFQLAVSDFKTSFNSSNGNFDVTVSFIGYMYGLYTDLPMSIVFTAPYYNESYWNEKIANGVFEYNGGGKILKFVEFMDKYYHLHNDMYESNSQELKEYKAMNDEVVCLDKIFELYERFEDQFLNSSFITVSDKKSEYFIIFSSINQLSIQPNIYEKLSKEVNDYNEKYNGNLSLSNISNYSEKSYIKFNYMHHLTEDYEDDYGIQLDEDNKKLKNEYGELIEELNNDRGDKYPSLKDGDGFYKYNYYAFFSRGGENGQKGLRDKIKDRLDVLKKKITDYKDKIDEEMSNVIKNKLGFNPTVENIYRMIFAHIETFFNAYEKTEKEISEEMRIGKRTKEFLGLTDTNSDIPKKSDAKTKVPPFPLCKDQNSLIQYPGTFYDNPKIMNIAETRLIETIIKGVKRFSKEFEKAKEKIDSLNDEATIDFIPVTVSDIFYDGKNPYLYLKNKLLNAQTDSECADYIEYFFFARMSMYIMATRQPNKFKDVFEQEFKNFNKCNINISEKTKTLLQDGTLKKDNNLIDCYFFKNPYVKDDTFSKYFNKEEIYTTIDETNPGLEGIKINLPSDTGATNGYVDSGYYLRLDPGTPGNVVTYDHYGLSYIIFKNQNKKDLGWYGNINANDWLFTYLRLDYQDSSIDGIDKYHAGTLQIGPPHKIEGKDANSEYVDDLYIGNGDGNLGVILNPKYENDLYFRAFLLLGCLASYFNLNKFCNYDISLGLTSDSNGVNTFNKYVTLFTACKYKKDELNYRSGSFLFTFPKVLLLYFGACVYYNRNGFNKDYLNVYPLNNLVNFPGLQNFKINPSAESSSNEENWKNNTDKFIIDLFFVINSNIFLDDRLNWWYTEINTDKFKRPSRYLLLSEDACDWLETYFKRWVGKSFRSIDDKLRDAATDSNKYKIVKMDYIDETCHAGKTSYFIDRTDNKTDNLIKKLLSEDVYLFKRPEVKGGYNNTCINDLLNSIKSSFKNYKTIEEKKEEEEKAEQRNYYDSSEQKKALYYTLKRLYDKWLSSYKMQEIQENPFKLEEPEDDKNNRKARYTSNADKNSNSEFDSFIFVDSFYRDISDKFLLNPDILVRLINSYGAKEIINSNASVFEFMNEIAEKNSLLFASIPVYSNFYDIKTIENIFSPNRKYGVSNSNTRNIPGNTYVIMYTGEASSKLDFGPDGDYDDDGITDIFGIGESKIPDGLSKVFSTGEGDGIDYTIPVFGVSYGKQNQMYFKNITVNMDEPKVTDYSIANLIQISYGGKNGDTEGYDVGIGQDIYSIYANRSYTCTVEMLGCINIMPMMYFQLNNIPMFRGYYMIISVSHSIVPGNMTTKFTGVRISKNHIGEVKLVFDYQSLLDKVDVSDSSTLNGHTISCADFVDERVGPHFMLSDFTIKSTTAGNDICNLPVIGEDWIDLNELITRVKDINNTIINPLWDAWVAEGIEDGFILTSGFRSQRTQAKLNGEKFGEKDGHNKDNKYTSAHTYGWAIDIQSKNGSNRGVFKKFVYNWIKNEIKNGKISIDQFIDEQSSGKYKETAKFENGGWVHIGFKRYNGEQRGMFGWTKTGKDPYHWGKNLDDFYSEMLS